MDAPCLLKAIYRNPGQAAKALFRLRTQVRRHQAEGLAQQLPLAHNGATALNRGRQPLVGVQRYRVGAFEAREERRDLLVENAERAIGPIDVQPEALLAAEIGQVVEGVHSPRVDCPGAGRNTEGQPSLCAVSFYCRVQSREVHLEARIDRNAARLTKSQQVRGLAQAAMPFF